MAISLGIYPKFRQTHMLLMFYSRKYEKPNSTIYFSLGKTYHISWCLEHPYMQKIPSLDCRQVHMRDLLRWGLWRSIALVFSEIFSCEVSRLDGGNLWKYTLWLWLTVRHGKKMALIEINGLVYLLKMAGFFHGELLVITRRFAVQEMCIRHIGRRWKEKSWSH